MHVADKKNGVTSSTEVNAIGVELADMRDKLELEYKRAEAQSRQDEVTAVAQMEAMAVRTLDLTRAEWSKKENLIAEVVKEAENSLRNTLTQFHSNLESCNFDDLVSSFVARAIQSDSRPEEGHS